MNCSSTAVLPLPILSNIHYIINICRCKNVIYANKKHRATSKGRQRELRTAHSVPAGACGLQQRKLPGYGKRVDAGLSLALRAVKTTRVWSAWSSHH
jgi:hypothetical protein